MLHLRQAPRTAKFFLLATLAVFTLSGAAPAMAQGNHGRRDRDRPYPTPPPGHHRLVIKGNPYYFHGGRYYRPWRRSFVPVLPPVGLVVTALPVGFQVLVMAGITYYSYGQAYYRRAPQGYVVVPDPALVQAAAAVPTGVVAPAQGAGGTATVIAQALNLRSGPGQAYPVLQVVNLGADLAIQGRTGSWLFVRTPDGGVGWVAQEFTTQTSMPASG
ncbi:MAG: SH3 domain-containing protein [Proteobacteria bacterium]|nr:SH3 domain-containing protein [Pseudomonadota bacterium]MBU1451497.1 SH3 domain-containing protein [Pseudomonadota bacterium]MBU2470468.1 SH3 domain-containing protein [Pseudomonadota bacterium]MBU2519029.1 SH3 domain-containing protein [Pseudomonadota bacterium]